ncbi:MAG TPA: MFS transporter [Cytophagaceae bacterium]|jgi:MFS family permease
MDLKQKQRFFLGVFFFLCGFCFATWASRIPTIKVAFDLNDAHLGTILLAMPISSLIGLPISGWLVSKYASRVPMTFAFIVNSIALLLIGYADNIVHLVIAISLFSLSLRLVNISMNTQSITLQKLFPKKINGSFHGLWSTGGILGVGFCTLMIAMDVPIHTHLLIVSSISLGITLVCYRYLITNDRATSGNKLVIGKPDPYIFYLGVLVFFAAVCEGGMFDWSGIFFREVIKTKIFTTGYLTFMICMAISRFASDPVTERIGMPRMYLLSASFVVIGILLSLTITNFWVALLGFALVGLGTAAVIPMTYSLAGNSTRYSAGMAISIIATYGIVGMLIGPPLIVYLSHAFGLKIAFLLFAFSGLMLIPFSRLFFKHQMLTYKPEDYKAVEVKKEPIQEY